MEEFSLWARVSDSSKNPFQTSSLEKLQRKITSSEQNTTAINVPQALGCVVTLL